MRVPILSFHLQRIVFPISAGLMGAIMLMGVYLGIVSLAESPKHALSLFWEDKTFVIPIMLGFGVQVGLYTLLKKGWHIPLNATAGGATTAASGGVSTFAMIACCAHHVADALPLLGLTAAATFLANWKTPFMIVGLISNLIGIAVMLSVILRERRRATQLLATLEAI
jgi:hypothetical protein